MRSGHLLFQTLKSSLAGQGMRRNKAFACYHSQKSPPFSAGDGTEAALAHLHTRTPHGPSSDLPQPGP